LGNFSRKSWQGTHFICVRCSKLQIETSPCIRRALRKGKRLQVESRVERFAVHAEAEDPHSSLCRVRCISRRRSCAVCSRTSRFPVKTYERDTVLPLTHKILLLVTPRTNPYETRRPDLRAVSHSVQAARNRPYRARAQRNGKWPQTGTMG